MGSRRIIAVSAVVGFLALGVGGLSGWVIRSLYGQERLPVAESRTVTARTFKVERVLNGNTFEIYYDDEPTLARIDNLECPLPGEPGGDEAREALANWIEGRTIFITFLGERKRDRLGHLLVRVGLNSDPLSDVGMKIRYKEQPASRPAKLY